MEMREVRRKVFHFIKTEEGKAIPLHVCVIDKVGGKGVESCFDMTFRIFCRQNPLPIKGEFHSSISVLFAWLKVNGWEQMPHVDTVFTVYKDKEVK